MPYVDQLLSIRRKRQMGIRDRFGTWLSLGAGRPGGGQPNAPPQPPLGNPASVSARSGRRQKVRHLEKSYQTHGRNRVGPQPVHEHSGLAGTVARKVRRPKHAAASNDHELVTQGRHPLRVGHRIDRPASKHVGDSVEKYRRRIKRQLRVVARHVTQAVAVTRQQARTLRVVRPEEVNQTFEGNCKLGYSGADRWRKGGVRSSEGPR